MMQGFDQTLAISKLPAELLSLASGIEVQAGPDQKRAHCCQCAIRRSCCSDSTARKFRGLTQV